MLYRVSWAGATQHPTNCCKNKFTLVNCNLIGYITVDAVDAWLYTWSSFYMHQYTFFYNLGGYGTIMMVHGQLQHIEKKTPQSPESRSKSLVFIVRGDVTWREIIIPFVKQKDFLRKTCCSLLNRIYSKTLNDCSLGKLVTFVPLESQCFHRPELGTHICLFNKLWRNTPCRMGLN